MQLASGSGVKRRSCWSASTASNAASATAPYLIRA